MLPVLEVVPSFPPLFSPSTKEFLARTAVDLKTPAKAPPKAPEPAQVPQPQATQEDHDEVATAAPIDPQAALVGTGEAPPLESPDPARPPLADEVEQSATARVRAAIVHERNLHKPKKPGFGKH